MADATTAAIERLREKNGEWTDPTPLTLDVLREELTPDELATERLGASPLTGLPTYCYWVGEKHKDRWLEWFDEEVWLRGLPRLLNVGQLRRVLSVIRETERSERDGP